MHCILPYSLEIDGCVKMRQGENIACNEPCRITLREGFDRDNIQYRYEITDRKFKGGSIVSPVVQDSKYLNIPFTVRSDSKEEFYDCYKFLKSVFNTEPYGNINPRNPNTAPLNRGGYVPITMCMRDGEDMTATGKMIQFIRERNHSDGCGADFTVQYILGNKNCTDEGCRSGDTVALESIASTQTNHPVPLSMDNCDREFSQQVDLYNLTQGIPRPYLPFPQIGSSLLTYTGQGKCRIQFTIEIKQSMPGPIVIYMMGANGSVQTLKIDIPQVSGGDFLIYSPDTNQFTGIISGQPIDAMQYVNMKCSVFPVLCPTPCDDFADEGFAGFNYFFFMETAIVGGACVSISCTNRRC